MVTVVDSIIAPAGGGTALAGQFRDFIAAATTITSGSSVEGFQTFVREAMPLLFADIRNLLPEIAERATLTTRWLTNADLLAVAGFRFVEDAYTELMAWALRPATHPASGVERQAAWLKVLGVDADDYPSDPCEPFTQMQTEDGIPDLVMALPTMTICVEAKTGSTEHPTPSGQPQTLAYPVSVRRALLAAADHRVKMVYLTPDGHEAENPEAVCTTYVEFVLAVAGALEGHDLPPDTRAAFRMLFTHLLTHATPPSTDAPALAHRIAEWSRQQGWDDHDQINERMHDLLKAVEVFRPARKR